VNALKRERERERERERKKEREREEEREKEREREREKEEERGRKRERKRKRKRTNERNRKRKSYFLVTRNVTVSFIFVRIAVDPGGSIPKFIVNWGASTGSKNFLSKVREGYEKYPQWLKSKQQQQQVSK
jgi:Flp pilus assembly protein TadB